MRLNVPLLAAVAATALVGTAAAMDPSWLRALRHKGTDALFRMRGPRRPLGDDIVIVGLDDRTRSDPELFVRRAGWARIVRAVAAAKPAAIGIDALFDAPERALSEPTATHAREAAQALRALPSPDPVARQALAALEEVIDEASGDEKLRVALAEAKVVWAGAVLFESEYRNISDSGPEPPGLRAARLDEVAVRPADPSASPPHASDYSVALPIFAQALHGVGLVNVTHDEDGATRSVPLVFEEGGRYYLPLALALARARLGAEVGYVIGERVVHLGDRELPVTPRGEATLDWLGRRRVFPHYSAIDVVSGAVPPAALTGQIVLIGYTDSARDTVQTPFDPLYPGVEVHATLLHNLLHGELLRVAGPMTTLGVLAILGALLAILLLRPIRGRNPAIVGVGAVALLVGWLALAYWLFASRRLLVDPTTPALGLVAAALASLSTALAVEGREKARLRSAFSQYLDDRAVKEILADPARLELGGQRRELTVLFSDIRGFTQLSERLDPQQVIAFLNAYLTPMTEIVWAHGGMLDKYIGDAVMAVYGAPLEQSDHPRHACHTALEMQRRLGELNRAWAAEGLPHLAIGIGLNTGEMSFGNMGSSRRKNYTVVGDAVNLGSRLEALTKEYGSRILVGERTRDLAGDAFHFRELDLVRVKGKDRPVRVYELLDRPSADDRFAEALRHYRSRSWDAAENAFQDIVAESPEDGPARVFLERVRRLRDERLPDEWDGVYEQHEK